VFSFSCAVSANRALQFYFRIRIPKLKHTLTTMSLSKKDHTEKLILVVQKYPILYDMTLREFKDTRKKDHLWDTVISQEMNKEKGNIIKMY